MVLYEKYFVSPFLTTIPLHHVQELLSNPYTRRFINNLLLKDDRFCAYVIGLGRKESLEYYNKLVETGELVLIMDEYHERFINLKQKEHLWLLESKNKTHINGGLDPEMKYYFCNNNILVTAHG